MKTIISIILLSLILFSCKQSEIEKNPIVEQINLMDAVSTKSCKYQVKLKTDPNGSDTYMYTNFKFEVGDTLVSYAEYFGGKLKPVCDSLISYQEKYKDLQKEFKALKSYTEFLERKLIKKITD